MLELNFPLLFTQIYKILANNRMNFVIFVKKMQCRVKKLNLIVIYLSKKFITKMIFVAIIDLKSWILLAEIK